MRLGTRSLLYGGHQFVIHPLAVAVGFRLYHGRWPGNWRVWLAIVCHDWGYWGLRDMDGKQGKLHPVEGARLIGRIAAGRKDHPNWDKRYAFWHDYAACHSRYFARIVGKDVSALAVPDKLATALMPVPLLALLFWLSGEWREYVDYGHELGYAHVPPTCYAYTRWIVLHWREEFLWPILPRTTGLGRWYATFLKRLGGSA